MDFITSLLLFLQTSPRDTLRHIAEVAAVVGLEPDGVARCHTRHHGILLWT